MAKFFFLKRDLNKHRMFLMAILGHSGKTRYYYNCFVLNCQYTNIENLASHVLKILFLILI